MARDLLRRVRRLPDALDRLDLAISRAAKPAPPPAPRRGFASAAALWFMAGVLIASLAAAGLWAALGMA
jgi:ferric-dicitrate binding protein FerR (iron transport regulator)